MTRLTVFVSLLTLLIVGGAGEILGRENTAKIETADGVLPAINEAIKASNWRLYFEMLDPTLLREQADTSIKRISEQSIFLSTIGLSKEEMGSRTTAEVCAQLLETIEGTSPCMKFFRQSFRDVSTLKDSSDQEYHLVTTDAQAGEAGYAQVVAIRRWNGSWIIEPLENVRNGLKCASEEVPWRARDAILSGPACRNEQHSASKVKDDPSGPHVTDREHYLQPILIHKIVPNYPQFEVWHGIEGRVILEVIIDRHGLVRDPKPLAGLGGDLLRAASDAVKKWTYIPARENGACVDAYTTISIDFTLR